MVEPLVERDKLIIKKEWFIDSKTGDIKEDYYFEKKLGEGGYGTVYQAIDKKKRHKVAVKAIRKKKVSDYKGFQNEISILKNLDHPNIIKVFETWETEQICFLITEICEGGELFFFITKKKQLNEAEAAQIMKQIFSAVKYCHDHDICHRDLKPENFLLKKPEDTSVIKLIDFGLSKKMNENELMSTPNGTPYYIAPEVLEGAYGTSCDNWSLGVVLYIMICGKPPFGGKGNSEILRNVARGAYSFSHPAFTTCSHEVIDLIKKLLTKSVSHRYTSKKAYDHPWIQASTSTMESYEMNIEVFQNMGNFMNLIDFKKTTLTFIASKIPEEDIDKLRKAFIKIDLNGDGMISYEEMKKGFVAIEDLRIGIEEKDLRKLMDAMDTNKNGALDYTEFIAACLQSYDSIKEAHLKEAFEYFDKDHNGKISVTELKQVMTDELIYQNEQIEDMMKEVDVNGDGEIDYSEFLKMMEKKEIS